MLYDANERVRPMKGKSHVFVNGQRYNLDDIHNLACSVALAAPYQRSTCDVPITEFLPADAGGTPLRVEIDCGDGKRRRTLYTGRAEERDYRSPPVSRTANGVDLLAQLSKSIKAACDTEEGLIFDNVPWVDAMRMVLNLAGITDKQIASIWNPNPPENPTLFNVGSVRPICHDATTENLDAVAKNLLQMVGATMYCKLGSGQVVVLPERRNPNAAATLFFSNIDNGAYRYVKCSKKFGGVEGIVSTFTCNGPEVEQGTQATSTYTVEGVKGRAEETSCDYWQTFPQTSYMAEWYCRLYCQENVVYSLDVPFDPDITVGICIKINAPEANLENVYGYVTQVDHRPTTTSITAYIGPSQADGYHEGDLPLCDFATWVEAELVWVNGQKQVRYFVHCDASMCSSPTNTIPADGYTWEVIGATPLTHDPATGSESMTTIPNQQQVVICVDKLTDVAVKLTVTDSEANTCAMEQYLDSPDVQVHIRVLQTIGDGGVRDTWSMISDLEQWYRFSRPGVNAVAIAKYNEHGPPLCLWSDRQLWQANDYLKGDPQAEYLSTLPGSGTITSAAMFTSETILKDTLIAANNELYFSRDGCMTFRLLKTFDAPITDVELGYDSSTYMKVCSGSNTWHSFSTGVEWEQAATGDPAVTAQAMANAPWGHFTVATGGTQASHALFVDDSETLQLDETTAQLPAELIAITPMLATPGEVVGHSDGRLWSLIQNEQGVFVVETCPELTDPLHQLLRDGKLGGQRGHGIYYLAGTPTSKLLNLDGGYPIDTDGYPSRRVSYCDWLLMGEKPFAGGGRFVATAKRFTGNGHQWAQYGAEGTFLLLEDGTWEHMANEHHPASGAVGSNLYLSHNNGIVAFTEPYTYTITTLGGAPKLCYLDNRPATTQSPVAYAFTAARGGQMMLYTYPDILSAPATYNTTNLIGAGTHTSGLFANHPTLDNRLCLLADQNATETNTMLSLQLHDPANATSRGVEIEADSRYRGMRMPHDGSTWGGVCVLWEQATNPTLLGSNTWNPTPMAAWFEDVAIWQKGSAKYPGQFYVKHGYGIYRVDFAGNATLVYEVDSGAGEWIQRFSVSWNLQRTRDYITVAVYVNEVSNRHNGRIMFSSDSGASFSEAGDYQYREWSTGGYGLASIGYVPED